MRLAPRVYRFTAISRRPFGLKQSERFTQWSMRAAEPLADMPAPLPPQPGRKLATRGLLVLQTRSIVPLEDHSPETGRGRQRTRPSHVAKALKHGAKCPR